MTNHFSQSSASSCPVTGTQIEEFIENGMSEDVPPIEDVAPIMDIFDNGDDE